MKNLAASVRARLYNLAKAQNEDFHRVVVRFALERLLYRLGQSRYRDRFVLKGAMLLLALGQTQRPTRDLDLLGFGSDDSAELATIFQEIMGLEGQDGFRFDPSGMRATEIREDQDYGGVRLQFLAHLDTVRVPVQVDIGFGDVVTPSPIEQHMPTLLDLPPPVIRAYPLETVVAEKFEAMVTLSLLNTRMKDLHDLWSIAGQFPFDAVLLRQAMTQTFARRHTEWPTETPAVFTDEFHADPTKQQIWLAFLRRSGLEGVDLAEVLGHLEGFLEPLWLGTAVGRWNPQGWVWDSTEAKD